jgi:alpha-beta hydrolase superfamily lysophospholipase
VFKGERRNKAYALGLGNSDMVASGYRTLREARKEALDGCRSVVQKKFGKGVETQCQLVMENDKLVWRGEKPRPMTENYLPPPDLPLARGMIFGSIRDSKGIVLHLHGCDGLPGPKDTWFSDWISFFDRNGLAVVAPDSLAERKEFVCGTSLTDTQLDPIRRLRVAQTLRTLSGLHKRFPEKPILIWGHSGGGNVAQMIKFDVDGIIITGASCHPASKKWNQPLLHVFGGKDRYSLNTDVPLPVTSKKVRTACTNYSNKGARRFVIVPGADHWVPVSEPAVKKALEEFLARLPD